MPSEPGMRKALTVGLLALAAVATAAASLGWGRDGSLLVMVAVAAVVFAAAIALGTPWWGQALVGLPMLAGAQLFAITRDPTALVFSLVVALAVLAGLWARRHAAWSGPAAPVRTSAEVRWGGRTLGGLVLLVGVLLYIQSRDPTILLFSLVVAWVFLCLWVYRDARSRGMRAGLWVLIVLWANVLGLLLYLALRPKQPPDQAPTPT